MNAGAEIRLKTNSKLNLFLRVAGRRSDGYHELESVFHGIDLGDTVTVEQASTPGIDVEVTLDPTLEGDLPSPEENLVTRAALALARDDEPHLRISIHKRIPIGGGLGGGSANAAGTLVALNELWGLDLDRAALASVAETIGADVPYCLVGGTSLARGRGEALTRLPAPAALWFVLGLSYEPLSTRSVYERWDEAGTSTAASSAPMALALGAGDIRVVAGSVHNDLEEPACLLRPALRGKKDVLLAAGALGAGMTGSGPTMFGIAETAEHARAIAARVEGEFDRVVCAWSAPRGIERIA